MAASMVRITCKANTCEVSSPYHPDFAPAAKRLGGKWSPAREVWSFDLRDQERVRELCRSVYGTDGTTVAGGLVTVRLTAKERISEDRAGIYFAGRCLCYATGRDSGARLSEGVVVLTGVCGSGGSVKNWVTVIKQGSVLELRDVPKAAVEVEISNNLDWSVEFLESPQDLKRAALEREQQQLQARLQEIDTELEALRPAPLRAITFEAEGHAEALETAQGAI